MLLSKTVKQHWNSKNRDRYVELGYTFTKMKDEFEISVNDLPDYSRVKVEVKCDYCGEIITKQWINYVSETKRNIVHKDACQKCKDIKYNDIMLKKYGTNTSFKVDEIKDKIKKTNLEIYGYENPSSSEIVRKKVAQTNIKRYGGIAPTCSKEVMKKIQSTCLKKYGVKSPLAIWDRKGKNNPNWKGGIWTVGRTSMECRNWKKSVYKKDNYTCQRCGARNGNGKRIILNAHHIFNWRDYEDLRYDIDNGITLCDVCHREFHKKYGKRNNNKNQIEEFLCNNG